MGPFPLQFRRRWTRHPTTYPGSVYEPTPRPTDLNSTRDTACPCGSGRSYEGCCGPYLDGAKEAPTAEALMRARYTAYVRVDEAYLSRTWHPTTRPPDLGLDDGTRWLGLSIHRTEAGGAADPKGLVEFTARCSVAGTPGSLREASQFVKEAGRWYYLDGDAPRTPLVKAEKIGRNAPCPCGSGKKYKRCCGAGR